MKLGPAISRLRGGRIIAENSRRFPSASGRSLGSSRGNEAQISSGNLGKIRGSLRRLLLIQRPVSRATAAFTLAEVLAALAFMAIVIPVAIEGLHIASRAGEMAQRKDVAARIADRVLNEVLVTGQAQGGSQNGVIQENFREYRWSIRTEPWSPDTMRLVTVRVVFPVQGQDYDVQLSTLISLSQ
jgi:type II secretion system protein I